MDTTFIAELSGTFSPFPHFWEHTIGSGHATLALRADWQQQLPHQGTALITLELA